jgi:tyrosinase
MAIALGLSASRSRRQLLGTAARGTIGGLGAALIARGLGPSLFDGGIGTAALAQDATVSIVDNLFEPAEIEVTVGTTVTWTNNGTRRHTVTADPDPGLFDSGQLMPGMTFPHTFDAAGSFDYLCINHAGMEGKVNVVEGGTPTPSTPYMRRNVNTLEPDDTTLQSYATAITNMKALPATDGRSWLSQAYTHGAFDDAIIDAFEESGMTVEAFIALITERAWRTCEHGNWFFWPWHRMYLYWFEQIVREMSGDPDWALPYWDYSNPAQRTLPAPFIDPSSSLFALRDIGVNAGVAPILSPAAEASLFGICPGLTLSNFTSASETLERTPHDQVHGWVGGFFSGVDGLMRRIETSALDPVFWLHHANLDRLWESWIRHGNANPPDPAWTENDTNSGVGVDYNFVDGAGNLATTFRIVNQVLSTTTMGYEYQELVDVSGCTGSPFPTPVPEAAAATPTAATHTTSHAQLELGSNTPPEKIELGPTPTDVSVSLAQPEAALEAAAAAPTTGGRVVLTLDGVSSEEPGALFQVYINLPSGQEPDVNTPYFVGTVSFFGLGPGEEGPWREHKAMQTFDISRNVEALQARGEWTGDVQVTFIPLRIDTGAGLEAAGATPAAAPPGPWATIDSVSIGAQ